MEFEVIILQDALNFLNSLDIKLKAKAFRTIELLQTLGPNLREPHAKPISGYIGMFELRIKVGSNIARLFYFHDKGKIFVVTSGYIKKTNKTDKGELTKAGKLRELFTRNSK